MSDINPDVIVVGAGGDGPALAWGLGSLGIEVLILEAGPWHGHEKWPNPHEAPGAMRDSEYDRLNNQLLEEQFSGHEHDMNDFIHGKLRWGPSNRNCPPWFRSMDGARMIWQIAGVGGTNLHYFGNHPRAYPLAIDDQPEWPINYSDLIPYYQVLEDTLPVKPAPTTGREELFYKGCDKAGWDLIDVKNVTEPGYRPMPNAIFQPDEKLRDGYDGEYRYPEIEGSTLAMNEFQGDALPKGAPVDLKAKRSSNVSYIPMALKTGNVTVQPNSFVTRVLTDSNETVTGVKYRHTWSGEVEKIECDSVVLAAGCIETPRIWKKSELPDNGSVGKGLTTHWPDFVCGIFDSKTLKKRIGASQVNPHIGQSGSARLDYPGLGAVAVNSFLPGISGGSLYGFSQAGAECNPDESVPWDTRGRMQGAELKRMMADYLQTLTIIIHTDDRPTESNGVRLDPLMHDEHGQVPYVKWKPRSQDSEKRNRLAEIAGRVMRSAGATHVHRVDSHPILLHLQSSMQIGQVLDDGCEAKDVDRLFVADHSALGNSLGGPNPTHTGQALALRTAQSIANRYFSARTENTSVIEACSN